MADQPFQRVRRFLSELRRRNVYQVAATYAVVGFVVIQVADITFPHLGLPSWAVTLVIALVVLGFPLALVLAWAFERTPEGVRRTPATVGSDSGRAAGEIHAGYKVLVGLGLVAAAVAGGWYLTGGGGENPEITERTVAVLPFHVSGSGAEQWQNAMVPLLSTGLDGAAGLRAIPARTVDAAWEQMDAADRGMSNEEALSVARTVGAEFAVLGSAAALGSELQLSADVRTTDSGTRLGQVEVRGSPDSVTVLADELTRRVMGVLAEETGEQLRSADLASETTHSVAAMKSYLAGLRHERAGEPGAVDDFETAIREDSTFALAYARIGFNGLWFHEGHGRYLRRAHELAGQLPERERRLVRALYIGRIEHRTVAAADSLRRLTEDYPQDPSVWQTLGEFVFHADVPRGTPEVEAAHERAVSLAPNNTSYYDHLTGAAFDLRRDSARLFQRVQAMPASGWKEMFQLGLTVSFGDQEERQRALAVYDTVSVPAPFLTHVPVLLPEYRERIQRKLLARPDLPDGVYAYNLVRIQLKRGHVREALSDLRSYEDAIDFSSPACLLAEAMLLEIPVPDSVARRYLDPENLPPDGGIDRLHCSGLYLFQQDRIGELASVIDRLRSAADTTADRTAARWAVEARIQELRGLRAWNREDLQQAARLLSRSNESERPGAILRGDLYRELGQLDRAEGWYLVAPRMAGLRLGRLYEEMDRPGEAAASYRRFIEVWEGAGEPWPTAVEEAREQFEQLTESDRASDD